MIGTEVIVEGGNLLDVYEGIDFSFNYSVSDIRNPDTRQTEFTKTIKVAGTANNNTLFGNLFEADIANPFDPNIANIGVNFNPNKKASVQVLQNSLPVLDGSMQLRKIIVTKGRVEYEVVFIGRLIDIFGAWGDRKMNEVDETGAHIIDLSEFDHDLTAANQLASWSAPIGEGYVYPLIDYGRNFTLDTFGRRTYPITDLRPSVYVRELWDKIFGYGGATYSGNFIESVQADGFVFDRLVIPWTAGFELSDQDVADRTVYAESTVDNQLFTTDIMTLELDSAPLNPFSQYDTATDTFTAQFSSTYVIEGMINATVTRTLAGIIGGVVPVTMFVEVNGTTQYAAGITNVDLPSEFLPVGTVAITNSPFVTAEIVLNAGDVVVVKYGADSFDVSVLNGDFDAVLNAGSFAQFRPVNEELAIGDLVRMNFGLPDITIKAFFLSILKMFNLYMLPDKSIPDHYIFYTRDQFYATGQLKDWTYKMDRGRAIDITPMGLLSGREYIYTYSEDGDYYNDRYQSNYGRAYGTRQLDIDNDFVPERKLNEIVFSPTPLSNDGVTARIIPKIYDADISEGRKPTDTNIRILYYGGLLDGVVTWQHGTGGTYYSDYPYAGHWDNPVSPTLDINFGLCLEYYYTANGATGTLTMTNNNLFKAYHERQFLELSNKDSKLVTANFNLTALDIHQLDFRDTILIDQTYYRLNRVMDYNPFKVGLTRVELFKAGDILWGQPEDHPFGSGEMFGLGKKAEPAPKFAGKTLTNGNQFEPFQGKVIGSGNIVSPNAIGFFVQGDGNQVGASQNVTLIGSNNVVANGVSNVVAIGVNGLNITQSDTVISGNGGVQVAKITLTPAQVYTLNTVNVAFGIAVPSGYYAKPLGVDLFMVFNTAAYISTTPLIINPNGSGSSVFELAIGVIDSAQDIAVQFEPIAGVLNQVQLSAEQDFMIRTSSAITTGDSPIDLYMTYILVPI